MLFHISNRHLDLEPVLGALAQDAGLVARVLDDSAVSQVEAARGKTESTWLVMARAEKDLGRLVADPYAVPPRVPLHQTVWTDDFSSLLSAFNWR